MSDVTNEEGLSEQKQNTGPMVYIGPTSLKLGLFKCNVYSELGDQIVETIEKYPALGQLFVTLDKWPGIRNQVIGKATGSLGHVVDNLIEQGVL